jgi:GTP-binding protein EngB required for normal cell division
MVSSTPLSDNPDLATIGREWADLKTYSKAKQVVARQIRALSNYFHTHKSDNIGERPGESQCRELMVKLAEDRFVLAVVGQFKRGKSSLMNAIIGRELLPTGVLPVTSVVTRLRFSPSERLLISRPKDQLLLDSAPLSALAGYVTQEGNPGNEKQINGVYVELPLPFLRRGVEFVDTPGVGSAIDANTATTMAFLPQCDAAVFVTSVDTPMTAVETGFLADTRQHAEKLFVVVNKIDLLEGREREEVLNYISETIRQQTGTATLRVFPVSSRLGLKARLAGDSEEYARSGLAALEETLAEFLSSEKSEALLVAVLNKSLRLTGQQPELADIETQLTRLRDIIVQHRATEATLHEVAAAEPPAPAAEEVPVRVVAVPTENAELLAAMATRGCPVCNHLTEAAFAFFARWQYDLSANEQVQRAFADELGFCPLHTWQLADLSSIQGLALGYPRLMERLANDFASLAASSQGTADPLATLRENAKTCRVCDLLQGAEQEYTARLAACLGDTAGRQAYAASKGACLRHLDFLLRAARNADVGRFLLAEAAKHFEHWAEDMQSYAIKRDALRRGLQNPDEEDAYLLALLHLAGNRSLCLPRAGDYLRVPD